MARKLNNGLVTHVPILQSRVLEPLCVRFMLHHTATCLDIGVSLLVDIGQSADWLLLSLVIV